MDKVTAAMVLTSLSTSPLVRSPPVRPNGEQGDGHTEGPLGTKSTTSLWEVPYGSHTYQMKWTVNPCHDQEARGNVEEMETPGHHIHPSIHSTHITLPGHLPAALCPFPQVNGDWFNEVIFPAFFLFSQRGSWSKKLWRLNILKKHYPRLLNQIQLFSSFIHSIYIY